MFALNQGEVCTCPSRALVDKKHLSTVPRAGGRAREERQPGDPLDTDTRVGAQASNDQLEKILSYIDIGKKEGARVLTGGERVTPRRRPRRRLLRRPDRLRGPQQDAHLPGGDLRAGGLGHLASTDFDDAIARQRHALRPRRRRLDPRHHTAFRAGRAIQAGRVWTNCYHLYPAHASFGGYKQSGIGRENHRMMLDHYQQTKNLLVSYDPKPMGFFSSFSLEIPEGVRFVIRSAVCARP
jgi:aldehyde dehydrogenase